MNIYIFDNIKYKLIKNYKDGFNKELFLEKYTDYFYDYDYIIGDWSYGKLRLKGFYKNSNKNCKDLNNFDYYENYIKNFCAYECKYFILEKLNKE